MIKHIVIGKTLPITKETSGILRVQTINSTSKEDVRMERNYNNLCEWTKDVYERTVNGKITEEIRGGVCEVYSGGFRKHQRCLSWGI